MMSAMGKPKFKFCFIVMNFHLKRHMALAVVGSAGAEPALTGPHAHSRDARDNPPTPPPRQPQELTGCGETCREPTPSALTEGNLAWGWRGGEQAGKPTLGDGRRTNSREGFPQSWDLGPLEGQEGGSGPSRDPEG